jgi:hypothetical protein
MGNCSSTSKCNPCGPNYDAINLLANKTASYARQANTSAVNAENYWKEFNALYLGSFASAPTVDNEGNPLQEGALYFNSVSNQMFVWQGASWIDFDFDEFTPFLATGTPTARNLVTRTSDFVNVKDFGAVGNGIADDTVAFQSAASSGKIIVVPKPSVKYKFASPFTITSALLSDPKTTWENLTDSGKLSYGSPFYPDTNGANISRIKDRLFVGDGADFTGNFNGTQAGFVPSSTVGAAWAPRDSVIFGATDKGMMAVTGFASDKNRIRDAYLPTIGVSGFAISEVTGPNPGSFGAWAMYADIQQNATVAPGSYAHGLEIAAKNNATNRISTPYLKAGGVLGIWLAGGGDPSYGGVGANPCNAGISFIKNGNTWNNGIVFHETSLTGCDGITGVGTAIAMAKGHQIEWWANGSTAPVSYIRCDMTSGAGVQRMLIDNGGIHLGTEIFNFVNIARVTNATNGFLLYPNVTGAAALIAATELNSNIRIQGAAGGDVEVNDILFPSVDNTHSCGKSGARWSTIWAANGTIQTSDEREKIEINDSELGLNFIKSLRPVSYKFKVGENVITEEDEFGFPIKIEPRKGIRKHFGLIAQEVKAALPEEIDFGGWILTDKNDQNSEQGLRYEEFMAPMIKAIQELSTKVEELKNK